MGNLKSEVERNQKLIKAGDELYYTDASNSQKWEVTETFGEGFEAVDTEGNLDFFIFSELQSGWEISEKTKTKNFLEHRFRYV